MKSFMFALAASLVLVPAAYAQETVVQANPPRSAPPTKAVPPETAPQNATSRDTTLGTTAPGQADFMATDAAVQQDIVKARDETRAAQTAGAAGDDAGACSHLNAAYSDMNEIIVLSDTYAAQLDAHDEYSPADKQKLLDQVNTIRSSVAVAQATVGDELKTNCTP
ncbi:MAG: hypothetical protein WDN06_05130 [Asticcacaulis sp.]